jgi:hypothetical protein
MNAQSHPYLQTASQAIQNGELDKAQNILIAILDQDPYQIEAWFLLSAAVEDPRGVAACLRNTLTLDPSHAGAIKMMAQLEQQTGLEPLVVMQVGVGSAALGQTCPYCSSPFKALERVVACPKCQVSHHHECWQENDYTCAAVLCDGFSLRDLVQQPLPLQPPETALETIVIRKEDLPNVTTISRKQQEERFQRRLLMLALMAEEGELPADALTGLPSIDELLDQIQRDRGTQPQATPSAPASPAKTAPPPSPPTASSYQSSGVVTGVIRIWPEQGPADAVLGAGPAPVCRKCSYSFQNNQAKFCPKCGAER